MPDKSVESVGKLPEAAKDTSENVEQEEHSPKSGSEQVAEPKEPTKDESVTESAAPPPNDWQAIYSPSHGAYYFFNCKTNETTWVNPLQPPETEAAEPEKLEPVQEDKAKGKAKEIPSSTPEYLALQYAAEAQGIDPALAYLDPSLLSATPSAGASNPGGMPRFTAKFNARTGAFAKPDARDPSHLSEHERAKRMSEVFFDVEKWEQDLARGGGSIKTTTPGYSGEAVAGDKRKRPSKKDLERFKEQKKQKKLAKTAWLRD